MFSLVWNRNKKMKKKQKEGKEKQRNEMKDAKEMKTSSHPSSSCHWGGHWAGARAVRDPKVANKKSQECREKRGGREEKQRGEERQQ